MACATCGRAGLPTDTWGVAEPPYPWEVPSLCMHARKDNNNNNTQSPNPRPTHSEAALWRVGPTKSWSLAWTPAPVWA